MHLKTQTVKHNGRDVDVVSHHSIDGSGHAIVELEARCGDVPPIGHRVTVAGHDHALSADYDLAQFEKDHAAATAYVAGLAESRYRAASLCAAFAAKHSKTSP